MRNIFKFRFAGVVIMLVMFAVFGVVVMLLWNGILPGLFGFPTLNYWRAIGILYLARILFGGIGHGFAWNGGRRDNPLFRGEANKLREKWMNMSEDERKEFVEKEKDYMGFHAAFHGRFPHLNRPFNDKDGQTKEDKDE